MALATPDVTKIMEIPIHQFVEQDTTQKMISKIQFGMFSGTEMDSLSEVKIFNRELYHHLTRQPVGYGPLDERLGTSNKKSTCKTCGDGIEECPGHFGVIKLSLPTFHIGYIKQIYNVLKMICKSCSRVLLDPDTMRYYLKRIRSKLLDSNQHKDLQAKILKSCQKMSNCYYCGAFNGDVRKTGPLSFIHKQFKLKASDNAQKEWLSCFDMAIKYSPEISDQMKNCAQNLLPNKVRFLFESIIPQDCELIGMSNTYARPEWMILTCLLVPPCSIRTSVQTDQQGGSNEDDLTIKLQEIIWVSDLIQSHLTKGRTAINQIMDHWEILQLQVALYINSEFPGIPLSLQTKKPIRGICQRLKGKQGRFRGNLSGKRVDFTSRTVISPDPNLCVDEIGVPIDVASTLTYPERVNRYNIDYMRQLVINGPTTHPGAVSVLYPGDGSRRVLKYGDRKKVANDLRIGDIVERHLHDGDIVLFNRQPSLHRVSIMSHRARVMPWKTFRFNECVCSPYNADFDGDEMNLHLLQTEEARAEAQILMSVTRNLATPRSGELLVSATQDFLTASWILTDKDRFLSRGEFCQIISGFLGNDEYVDLPPPVIHKPVQLYTGKQIFSILLQPNKKRRVNVNLRMPLRNYDSRKGEGPMNIADTYLVIYNGEVLCGQLDKSVLGGGKNTLFSNLLKYFDSETSADRMSKLAKMCARFIGNYGFSIGISDVTPTPRLTKRKIELVNEGYKKCDNFIKLYSEKKLEAEAGSTLEQTLESRLESTLSEIRDQAGKLCIEELNQYDHLNAPLIMTLCGSKGSKINVSQMIACVGQQTVNGQRVPNGFINRSLPHFDIGAKDPAAKGFVSNSFYTGLTPTEFFFHTMGGREGLVDTAVKTAETGYMQRRLMKALEDFSVQYDGTVRDTKGNLVQFVYGDDGIEPTFTEVDSAPFDLTQQWKHALLSTVDPNPDSVFLKPYEILEYLEEKLSSKVFQKFTDKFISDIREHFRSSDQKSGVVDKLVELRKRLELSEELERPNSQEIFSQVINVKKKSEKHSILKSDSKEEKDYKSDDNDDYCDIDVAKKESLLNQLICISRKTLDYFFDRIVKKILFAQAEPGTAVGAICAQSIGEPCTQMTLKTFHFAGVASMNITLGVPRIREIINVTKAISTPIIEVKLENEYSKDFARVVKGRIERTTLGEIAEYIKEVYSPEGCYLKIKIDLYAIENLFLECCPESILKSILGYKKLKLKPSNISLTGADHSEILVYSPENMVRKGTKDSERKNNIYFTLQKMKSILPGITICGFDSVKRCVIREDIGKNGAPDRYSLLVEGQDILAVMTQLGVKPELTKSNHLIEVQNRLGIEASRRSVIDEIAYTMKLHGVYVDPRHLYLLADTMTSKGEIHGITRFGISKMNDSTLMLASFEKTTDYLFDAGHRALLENIIGISECIIMGRPVPLGTGLFKLLHRMDIKEKLIAKTPILGN